MSSDPPSKKEQLLRLLDRGSVFVHLDPRRLGVRVPPWLTAKPQLVLQLGRNFAIPIPDLLVDDRGVRCTLSFNRSPFLCELPWPAIYALAAEDGQMTFWPADLPSEMIPEVVRKNQPTARGTPPRTKPRISAVPGGAEPKGRHRPPPAPTITQLASHTSRAQPALALPSDAEGDKTRTNTSKSPTRTTSRPPSSLSKTPRERPPWLRVVK